MRAQTAIRTPADAVDAMLDALGPVAVGRIDLGESAGRVLAEPVITDRPSPPADVSAMDGYALRVADAGDGRVPIAVRILPGRPAPPLPPGSCAAIMTGAVVPAEAEAVVKREDTQEHDAHIVIGPGAAIAAGMNIRRRGENERAGAVVVEAGRCIDAPVTAALASFAVATPAVYRPLRIVVVVTGDELIDVHAPVNDWQIRDSNGPTVRAMLAPLPWVRSIDTVRVRDDRDLLTKAIRERLDDCDAMLVTGGVSAGTHDFVPEALAACVCSIVFHRLPIRPGGPVLGAIGPSGQLVMGLPGNPLSVMCTLRRIGAPLLRRRAGFAEPSTPARALTLREHDGKTLGLWWYRPVSIGAGDEAVLVPTRGSGDIVSAARSDGIVEIEPNAVGRGPLPFYPWSVS